MSALPVHSPAARSIAVRRSLRLALVGSVDDGKSTLLGRLLWEAGAVPEDQWQSLLAECRRRGMPEGEVEWAWLCDGLEAEREQGITIDVAWRYLRLGERMFIIADCPGHEQYTRNMASGLSRSELAVLLLDASRGATRQTLRHLRIAALFGVREVVLAVNKMDRVDYDEARFRELVAPIAALAEALKLRLVAIPLAARAGENVASASGKMPWYEGPSLLSFLLQFKPEPPPPRGARLPVSLVLRAEGDFRGYAGTLSGGVLAVGDPVVLLPSGQRSAIAEIRCGFEPRQRAFPGEAVLVRLERRTRPRSRGCHRRGARSAGGGRSVRGRAAVGGRGASDPGAALSPALGECGGGGADHQKSAIGWMSKPANRLPRAGSSSTSSRTCISLASARCLSRLSPRSGISVLSS